MCPHGRESLARATDGAGRPHGSAELGGRDGMAWFSTPRRSGGATTWWRLAARLGRYRASGNAYRGLHGRMVLFSENGDPPLGIVGMSPPLRGNDGWSL